MASVPVKTPGPVPPFILVAFLSACTIAYLPSSRSLPGLHQLWQLGLFLLRSEGGVHNVVTAGVLMHCAESLYTGMLVTKARLPLRQRLGWFLRTLLLGYGAIKPLKEGLKGQRASRTPSRKAHATGDGKHT